MERVEPALSDAMLDRAPAEAHRKQLPTCDHSVLSFGELADPAVHWSTSTIHFMVDVDHLVHGPDDRSQGHTGEHAAVTKQRRSARMPAMSAFDELGEIPPQQLFEGVVARAVHGERITFATVELAPHAVVAEHSHDQEQLGAVLRGQLTLRIGDEERVLGPGATWRIAPNVVHSGHAGPEGAEVIDVFSPPRDDWQAATA